VNSASKADKVRPCRPELAPQCHPELVSGSDYLIRAGEWKLKT